METLAFIAPALAGIIFYACMLTTVEEHKKPLSDFSAKHIPSRRQAPPMMRAGLTVNTGVAADSSSSISRKS